MNKLEPTIRAVIDRLCRRLREYRDAERPVNLGDAYAALTMDIITEYCFAQSFGCVDTPDFAPEWPAVIKGGSALAALNKQFPSLVKFMKTLPESLVQKLNPNVMLLIKFQKV